VQAPRLHTDADLEFALKIRHHASKFMVVSSLNLIRVFRLSAILYSDSTNLSSFSNAKMELAGQQFSITPLKSTQVLASRTLDVH
jgi:hypothetical protein